MKKPVSVIVPVYNGLEVLRELVESLAGALAKPNPLLRFIFIDDASPDRGVGKFLKEHAFLRRADVRVERNPANRGFAGTVNRAIGLADPASDVLLLNSDTQLHGNAIAHLQATALRFDKVASVTPFTNNGTIASLFDWPAGGGIPFGMTPAEVTEIVEASRAPTPFYSAPTGIGFCMYITRAALEAVGTLDEAGFAKGYGEENDWCQRAIRAGYLNLISPETFVYHHGGQSFTSKEKKELAKTGFAVLEKLYPGYLPDVARMIAEDPLREARARLLWEIARAGKARLGLRTVTLVLHNDPEHPHAGTERHVSEISAHLAGSGRYQVIHVFSAGEGAYRVRLLENAGSALFDFTFERERFQPAFAEVLRNTDVLHLHSTVRLAPEILKMIEGTPVPGKFFTAHDFTAVCPSMHLADAKGRYCGLPDGSRACNLCLKETHRYTQETMETYRARMADFLGCFDSVFVPSASARKILLEGMGKVGKGASSRSASLASKTEVLPHFLPFGKQAGNSPPVAASQPGGRPLIVFLGFMVPHKGSDLLVRILGRLRSAGYRVEVWGPFANPHRLKKRAKVRPYQTWGALRARFKKQRPHLVCLPSLVPETFSYTLFEALLLGGTPVVVGPHGNPARVVKKLGVGQVMEGAGPSHLLRAIHRADKYRAGHLRAIQEHWALLKDMTRREPYFERLEEIYQAGAQPKLAEPRRGVDHDRAPAPPGAFVPISRTASGSIPHFGGQVLSAEHAWLAIYAPLLTRLKNLAADIPGMKSGAAFLLSRIR